MARLLSYTCTKQLSSLKRREVTAMEQVGNYLMTYIELGGLFANLFHSCNFPPMEQVGNYLMTYIELGGLFAPVLFISFHLLRPLFFLPVVFICISGGVLFGTVAGAIYSLI